jgi:transposase-like protein
MILARTADWVCTRCGSTNRKLVPNTESESRDRCVSCKAAHEVRVTSRPVRWEARLAS